MAATTPVSGEKRWLTPPRAAFGAMLIWAVIMSPHSSSETSTGLLLIGFGPLTVAAAALLSVYISAWQGAVNGGLAALKTAAAGSLGALAGVTLVLVAFREMFAEDREFAQALEGFMATVALSGVFITIMCGILGLAVGRLADFYMDKPADNAGCSSCAGCTVTKEKKEAQDTQQSSKRKR